MAHQVHRRVICRAPLHGLLHKVGQLLNQVRPVAGDGVARVVPEAIQCQGVKTLGLQPFQHQAVGAARKTVAVAEDDQRFLGFQIRRSCSLLIFFRGRLRPLPVSSGTSVWLPSQVGCSMLSNTSRSFWPQVLCTILK